MCENQYHRRMKSTPVILRSVNAGIAAAGIGRGELAAGLGISRNTLTNKFAGRTQITVDDLDRFAAFFGVDPADFINGPGEWLGRLDLDRIRARVEQGPDATADATAGRLLAAS